MLFVTLVLQADDVAQLRLHSVRSDERAGLCLDELHRHAKPVAGAEQRAGHDQVDVGFHGDLPQVEGLGGQARGGGGGADHQGPEPGQ